jgi:hypothetical protein
MRGQYFEEGPSFSMRGGDFQEGSRVEGPSFS